MTQVSPIATVITVTCFWTASDFCRQETVIAQYGENGPVNLSDYDMSAQVFSWQHNNKTGTVKIFGVDGPGAKVTW